MQFNEKLKLLRTNKFYTQADLAEGCNTAIFTVSRWETGSSFPTYKTIAKISIVLDVTPSDFLDDDITDQKKITEIKRAQNFYDKYEASKAEENEARSTLKNFGEKYRKTLNNQSNNNEKHSEEVASLEKEKDAVLDGMLKASNAKQSYEFDMASDALADYTNDCDAVRYKISKELYLLNDKGLNRLQRFIEFCLMEDEDSIQSTEDAKKIRQLIDEDEE